MKFELKPLSRESVGRAIDMAERYRLLGESEEAESICRDILRVDPGNQRVVVIELLALTDQFFRRWKASVARAQEMLTQLEDPYEKVFYAGIIAERKARARLRKHIPGAGDVAFRFLAQAMKLFEQAEQLKPPGNDDAILRWNSCARTIMDASLEPTEDGFVPLLE